MSELLQELAAAGAVETRGGFTIDPEKAREKLRQYQLADPYRYVLLLVEAAVSIGASKLEFEIDSDDLHLRFDGPSFAYEQLENIYGSLFASIGEVAVEELTRLQGLRQLAFAINSAMALNPRFVRVVSVGADGSGTQLELRPDAPDRIERLSASAERPRTPGNWIHVKDRFRPGLVVEFFQSLRGNLVEIQLLREYCRWSRTPVHINGQLISGALEFDQPFWTMLDVYDPPGEGERIGRAALLLEHSKGPPLAESSAVLLCKGVFFERVPVPGGVPGFAAIVDSPRLGKDVSQTKLLRDEGYDALMRAIAVAQDRIVARVAERCLAGFRPSWAPELLLAWLRQQSFASLHEALREHEGFAVVADVPLWPVIGGNDVSTRMLIESEGPIRYASRGFGFAPLDVPFVVDLSNDYDDREAVLKRLFGARLHDYTGNLRREHERQRKRLEFMARMHLPELDDGHYPIRRRVVGEQRENGRVLAIRGELGVRMHGPLDSWVRLLHEGCVLEEVQIEHPLPGLRAVVQAQLTPEADYEGAQPDERLTAALLALLESLSDAMTELAASKVLSAQHTELRELVRQFVCAVTRPDYALEFFMQFGFSRAQAKRELDRVRSPRMRAIQPDFRLAAAGERHPIAEVPLFARVLGGPLSLADLYARRAAGQRLAWLEHDVGPVPKLDVEVLLLDQRERELLRAVLDNEALEPFAERLAWIRRRDAFLERPKITRRLPQPCVVTVGLEDAHLPGELGLRNFSVDEVSVGAASIRVYYRERSLCELTLELPLPGLVAWVEADELEINRNFDGLAHPLSLREPLLRALVNLVARELERAQRSPAELRRCEWWLLAMVPNLLLGPHGLAQAFVQLRKAGGFEQALADLDRLLALLERCPEHDIGRALGRLRGNGELPTPAAVEKQLRRPSRRLSEAERDAAALRRALLPVFRQLLELPLLRRFTGRAVDGRTPREVTLATVFAQAARGEPLSWVGEDFQLDAMPTIDFELVGLDPVEQRLLQAQLGSSGLELVDGWLQGRAQFERRRTTAEIRVPRGAVLTVLEVSGPGWRGELGIVCDSPRKLERSKVRVFTHAREAALVDLPTRPLPLLGALEFDELELNERFDDVTPAQRESLRQLVLARSEELIMDLVARYPSFERSDKRYAAELVRYLLLHWPPGNGGYAARARKRPKLFRQLAELPVFPGVRKSWSAAELVRARGPLKVIPQRQKLELPEGPVVVLDADDIEPTLRALFGQPQDYLAELERARELAARKQAAPRLPKQPPSAALASARISSEQLVGYLWIGPGCTEVLFGAEGRVVDKRTIAKQCWCAGAIWGEGLNVSADWTGVTLTRAQERLLERTAVDLWSRLLADFLRASESEPPRTKAERERFASSRDALLSLFMRLHGLHKWTKRGSLARRKRKAGNRLERLYEQLCTAPLLELSNGRWISAEVAERERPIELAALELWTGPSAEELAQQRVLERRDAERQRQAEIEAQRQAEAARRRAAAEARQREAARRREAQRQAAAEREAAEREAERRAAERKAPRKLATPEQQLLEDLREELRLVRADKRGLLSNRLLDSLVLGSPVRRGPLFRRADNRIEIDTGHRLFQAVLAAHLEDPALLSLLASAAYSFLNIVHSEIADEHEAEFLRLHAAHASTGGPR